MENRPIILQRYSEAFSIFTSNLLVVNKKIDLTIRAAVESDVPMVLSLIRELAGYEKLLHAVEATEERLHDSLFVKNAAEALIAEDANQVYGFALFFHNFSTFVGKPGLYLEDIYVKPAFRGFGIGKAIFRRLMDIAAERDCGRMEWSVLKWNTPAIEFYKSLGASAMDEWTVYRLSEKDLKK